MPFPLLVETCVRFSRTNARRLGVFVLLSAVTLVGCGGSGSYSSGSGSGGNSSNPEYLYVSSGTPTGGIITAYAINASTGALSAMGTITIPAPIYVVQMKVDPSSRYLYASDFDTGTVHSFSISSSSGALAELPGSPFSSPLLNGNGGPIGISPNGKFLYATDTLGTIANFTVSSGLLTPGTASILDGNQPFDFAFDPAGKFLFVANQADPSGNEFSVYSVSAADGALAEIPGSPFTYLTNSSPYSIAVHPNGQFVFATQSPGVSSFSLNSVTGVISPVPNSPWRTQLGPQGLAIDPKGRFLYASAAGIGSVSAFTIDATTGQLTEVSNSPYLGYGPIQLVVDPSGKFLYSVYPGTFSNSQILAWQIDQTTGALTRVPGSPFAAGSSAYSLAVVQLP